jgi:hypothetical protein
VAVEAADRVVLAVGLEGKEPGETVQVRAAAEVAAVTRNHSPRMVVSRGKRRAAEPQIALEEMEGPARRTFMREATEPTARKARATTTRAARKGKEGK